MRLTFTIVAMIVLTFLAGLLCGVGEVGGGILVGLFALSLPIAVEDVEVEVTSRRLRRWRRETAR